VRRLLVVEDGTEYAEFARLFLSGWEIVATRSGAEAIASLAAGPVDAMLLDLRFERADPSTRLGDVAATAARLFAGDRERAVRHLAEQQGTLVLAALRAAGCDVPAVFVHDFPPRRLENLRRMYGRVGAVPSFDAAAIARALSS
jgi:CheY-like chemotaxis protein